MIRRNYFWRTLDDLPIVGPRSGARTKPDNHEFQADSGREGGYKKSWERKRSETSLVSWETSTAGAAGQGEVASLLARHGRPTGREPFR